MAMLGGLLKPGLYCYLFDERASAYRNLMMANAVAVSWLTVCDGMRAVSGLQTPLGCPPRDPLRQGCHAEQREADGECRSQYFIALSGP